MESALLEFVKVYGPLGLGWVLFLFLLRHVLASHKAQIEAELKLASAIESLEKWVREAMK